jgi:hypothetical protein
MVGPRRKDLSGRAFHSWTVVEFSHIGKHGEARWKCRCHCGAERMIDASDLLRGTSKCCGCNRPEIARKNQKSCYKHGHARDGKVTPTFKAWASMIQRCYTKTDARYRLYGAKGVAVCERWRESFETFLEDMGERPTDKHSLDRFPDPFGNYEPGNCRWATTTQQNRNKRTTRWITCRGETLCLADWAERTGVPVTTILGRLTRGWEVETALYTPRRF